MLSQLKAKLRFIIGNKESSRGDGGLRSVDWYDAVYRDSVSYSLPYWESHYYFTWSVITDRIRNSGLRRVLDIGCGAGQLAACLLDSDAIDTYVGLDFSSEAIRMAQRACPRAQFVVGDARTTQIHSEVPHDLIVCTEVLEHVPEDEVIVSSFTPGKRCICTVPNFPWESHVRHFEDEDHVVERYGNYFDSFDVRSLRVSDRHLFYLMDGIRNSFGRNVDR
jgi:trans-aconitate methyltransferase